MRIETAKLEANVLRVIRRDGAVRPSEVARSLYGDDPTDAQKTCIHRVCTRLVARGQLAKAGRNSSLAYSIAPAAEVSP